MRVTETTTKLTGGKIIRRTRRPRGLPSPNGVEDPARGEKASRDRGRVKRKASRKPAAASLINFEPSPRKITREFVASLGTIRPRRRRAGFRRFLRRKEKGVDLKLALSAAANLSLAPGFQVA